MSREGAATEAGKEGADIEGIVGSASRGAEVKAAACFDSGVASRCAGTMGFGKAMVGEAGCIEGGVGREGDVLRVGFEVD